MKWLKNILFLILISCSLTNQAQDPLFTQFFSNALYLNPAMAGRDLSPRIHSTYRNQWPGINKAYVTYNLEYDQFAPDLHGGVGFQVMHDRTGNGLLNTLQFSGCYAYQLLINREWTLNFGVKASFVQKSFNWGEAIWGDQLDPSRGNINTSNQPQGNNANYVDFSNGLILFGKNLFVGAAFNHLTRPNESFLYNTNIDASDNLAIRSSFHGGYKIRILKNGLFHQELFVTPEFVLDFQSNFKRLNFGTYFVDGIFDLGFWYRHTRIQDANNAGFAAQDAIVIVFGIEKNNLKFGYSYDFNLSNLVSSSIGAHEVSITLDIPSKIEPSTKFRVINCPQF